MRASTCAWAIVAAVSISGCGDDGDDGETGSGGAGGGSGSSTSSSSSATASGGGDAGATTTTGATSTSTSSGGGDGGAGGSGGAGGGGGADVTPPTTTFAAAPLDGQSNGLPSAFELTCSEPDCTFECSLGGAPFVACDASVAFDPLAPGDHTLEVRATDAAGNVEDPPAVHDWLLVLGWRAVASSYDATCAVSGDRQLYCWGSDDGEILGDGPGGPGSSSRPLLVDDATDWVDVSAGADAICARKDSGALHCWGEMYALGGLDTIDVPTLYAEDLARLEASYDFSCGLESAGGLFCAGDGTDGTLGDGDLQDHYAAEPTAVGADRYTDVAVGGQHACAVRDDGRLLCWGLAPNASMPVAVPTPIDGDLDWSRVAAGESHTCAVKSTGGLYCWGSNYAGQLGRAGSDPVLAPEQVGADEDWVDVFASEATTCAVKADGATSCWGSNYRAEVGSVEVALDRVDAPTRLASSFREIAGRGDVLCGLTTDGFVRCWGDNYAGRLGRGVEDFQPAMIAIDDGFDVLSVTDGGGCGIREGELLCWGSSRSNGLLPGFVAPSPAPLSADGDWTTVSVSIDNNSHACAIRDESLYCWGSNAYGQLGDGSTEPSAGPVPVIAVSGVTGWRDVSVGIYATCAIATNSDMYCWGLNEYGQLGVGSSNLVEPLPVKVEDTGWDSVHMGRYRTAARRLDGTFWHWGVNDGIGPSQLPGTDWVDVGTTGFAECGVKTNGTLHCTQQGIPGVYQAGSATDWAHVVQRSSPYCALNTAGAVGCFVPATQTSFNTSPAIESGDGWLSLHGSDFIKCGLRAGGERQCRGARRYGSLGDGFDERVPTLVIDP